MRERCGVWGVGCGMSDVEYEMWERDVGCGVWGIGYEIFSLNL